MQVPIFKFLRWCAVVFFLMSDVTYLASSMDMVLFSCVLTLVRVSDVVDTFTLCSSLSLLIVTLTLVFSAFNSLIDAISLP